MYMLTLVWEPEAATTSMALSLKMRPKGTITQAMCLTFKERMAWIVPVLKL
jgi:hypothetical protein